MSRNVTVENMTLAINTDGTATFVHLPQNTANSEFEIPAKFEYQGQEYQITAISKRAFFRSNLKTVTFAPDSFVMKFNEEAFLLSKLVKLQLPPLLSKLEPRALSSLKDLEEIDVSKSNQNFCLKDGILYDKDARTLLICPNKKAEVVVPKTVEVIGEGAFEFRNDLAKVSFEEGSVLHTISKGAFYTTQGLKSIVIPKSVVRICENAFDLSGSLESVTFEDGSNLEEIGLTAFHLTGINSITIPKHVKKIGNNAFRSCKNLVNVNFEQGSELESIGESAFGETKLKEIIIPEKVTGVKDVFKNCSSLETIYFLSKTTLNINETFQGKIVVYDTTTVEGFPEDKIQRMSQNETNFVEEKGYVKKQNSEGQLAKPKERQIREKNSNETYKGNFSLSPLDTAMISITGGGSRENKRKHERASNESEGGNNSILMSADSFKEVVISEPNQPTTDMPNNKNGGKRHSRDRASNSMNLDNTKNEELHNKLKTEFREAKHTKKALEEELNELNNKLSELQKKSSSQDEEIQKILEEINPNKNINN